jgi:hypothetical protein
MTDFPVEKRVVVISDKNVLQQRNRSMPENRCLTPEKMRG